jgi:hypothetical protein
MLLGTSLYNVRQEESLAGITSLIVNTPNARYHLGGRRNII